MKTKIVGEVRQTKKFTKALKRLRKTTTESEWLSNLYDLLRTARTEVRHATTYDPSNGKPAKFHWTADSCISYEDFYETSTNLFPKDPEIMASILVWLYKQTWGVRDSLPVICTIHPDSGDEGFKQLLIRRYVDPSQRPSGVRGVRISRVSMLDI
jgi:hypothetical protein